MGKLGDDFGMVIEGSLEDQTHLTNDLSNDPLTTLEKWLDSSEVAQLANVAVRVVQKKMANLKWHGTDLRVKTVSSSVGRGGKTKLLHVDHLPPEFKEKWYAQQGIKLHERQDPITGKTIMVPEQRFQPSAVRQKAVSVAEWRMDVVRPAMAYPKGSAERSAILNEIANTERRFPNGKRKTVSLKTLYNWVKAIETDGLHGAVRKTRADTGTKRQKVTRAWDAFFEAHIDAAKHAEISDELTTYIRSLWAAGERGWRSITEKSTTRLIEMSRGLNVLAFEALELGRCGDTNAKGTQFGICNVNRRQVEHHREYALLAIKDKDNAVFQDNYMPSIRRDYSTLLPRQIVVGDRKSDTRCA